MKKIYELNKVSENLVLPSRVREAINYYVWYGRPVGDFVYAILCNSLSDTILRADNSSLDCIKDICIYVHNAVPSGCYGSIKKVEIHLEKGELLNENI